MINWAIRYQPVVKHLRRLSPAFVLDVGSGPEGLALLWKGRVVGADLRFKRRPMHRGVRASCLSLPFADGSCPAVVSCDMLEHVPASQRKPAVTEMSRVASGALLLGFPSGRAAGDLYRRSAEGMKAPLPAWLREHLELGLPEAAEVTGWLRGMGWSVQAAWHEPVDFHRKALELEAIKPLGALSYLFARAAGPWLVDHLPEHHDGDYLRVLICATR